jgi:GTPase SAR1 family protein
MVSLETLILRSNNLSEISEESIAALQQVNKLNHLDISENKITVFPASLSNIPSLRTLDVEHNKITYLPNEFVKFENNLEQFFCSGNSLHSPLQEMAERKSTGLQFIFRYLKKFKSGAISNSLKVIIIGNEMAGKSTFARSLKDKISFSNKKEKVRDSFDSTIGIDIHECKIEDEKRNLISLNIWDFAGQGIYHSVHEVFFTKNALYLLIWDVRYENFDEYVYFWVALINARVPGASILIIATHADIPTVINTGNVSASDDSLDIQAHKQKVIENIDKLKEYLCNRECARIYQLKNESKNLTSIIPEGPNIIGYFFTGFTVSNCNVDEKLTCVTYGDVHFDQIVGAIKKIITSSDVCPRPLGIIGYPLVDIWIKVEDILNESRRSFRFISIQDIHSKVKERFSNDGSIELMDIVDAVDFFSMCGEVVYFTSSIELEATHDELHDLVFLSPLWLMEMIKIVLDHNIRNCFRSIISFNFEIKPNCYYLITTLLLLLLLFLLLLLLL